jgi:hypothetical protein
LRTLARSRDDVEYSFLGWQNGAGTLDRSRFALVRARTTINATHGLLTDQCKLSSNVCIQSVRLGFGPRFAREPCAAGNALGLPWLRRFLIVSGEPCGPFLSALGATHLALMFGVLNPPGVLQLDPSLPDGEDVPRLGFGALFDRDAEPLADLPCRYLARAAA